MVSWRYHMFMSLATSLEFLNLAERLAALIEGELKPTLADAGLLPVHARMLEYLAQANRYSNTPQAVAEYLGATKGTVSQSLRLLERKGLLCRERDVADRRSVRLFLSEKGHALLRRLRRLQQSRLAVAAVAPKQVEWLRAALRELQLATGRRSFGLCHTCLHHLGEEDGNFRCGLTGERLSGAERDKICRDHAPRKQARP